MAPSRGIYFACDNSPRLLYQLERSVESVRASNCDLPIHVLLVGEVPRSTAELLAANSARLIVRRWDDYPPFVRRQPTFLKWVALREGFDCDELLFLDADTFAFRDPGELFDAVGPEDLHARRSFQALETDVLTSWGMMIVHPPGCWPGYLRRYEALREHLKVPAVLGFNSGIMLFKNRAHRRLGEHQALFAAIRRMFYSGRLPYPMPMGLYLMDEEVARLAVGVVGGITCKEIPPALCPYYIDSCHRLGAPPAILTHTFRMHYAHFLLTRFGEATCRRYVEIEGRSSGRRRRKFLLQWAWIALLHGSGLSRIGMAWKCARARTMLDRIVQARDAEA